MSDYKIGYARVSTAGQDEALQLDALQGAGVDRVFVDRASGTLTERPGLTSALECARPGDSLVVWRLDRLDRLGRSLRHLIEVVKDLEDRQVALVSLTEQIDTCTPGGKLIFHVFGALAEFEAALTRQRTTAGLAAAPGSRSNRRQADRLDPREAAYRPRHASQRRLRRRRHRPRPGGQPSIGLPSVRRVGGCVMRRGVTDPVDDRGLVRRRRDRAVRGGTCRCCCERLRRAGKDASMRR